MTNSASAASCDVVVVGGGPAGAASALLLARAGHDVMLLDRALFPRAKACGDCISPGANQILRRIGVWDDVLRAAPAWLDGWRLTAPGSSSFGADFAHVSGQPDDQRAIAIERRKFDAVLLAAAQSAGVRVVQGARVVDVTRDERGHVTGVQAQIHGNRMIVKAHLTIGADGLRSVVARRLHAYARAPRLRKTSFTMHMPLERNATRGEMYLSAGACLGIAPVECAGARPLHNVTLVLAHGRYDPHAGARSIFANGLKFFDVTVPPATAGPVLTSGPFDWPVRTTTFNGAALVGDAAGYYDPFTGQGIYQALAGAELLAAHACDALRAGRVTRRELGGYARAQRELSAGPRRLQRLFEFVCARPGLASLAFARLSQRPELARALIGVTGDLLPAGTLFSPSLLRKVS